MPIILLEIKTAFGLDDTAAMTSAFEEALKRLNIADREAPMATSVAKKIIRLAKKGECNPTRLTEGSRQLVWVDPVTVGQGPRFHRRVRPPGGFSLVEASSTGTRLRGWACRTRTQKCRRKISL